MAGHGTPGTSLETFTDPNGRPNTLQEFHPTETMLNDVDGDGNSIRNLAELTGPEGIPFHLSDVFDVVRQYNGSGKKTQTTGTIPIGSTALSGLSNAFVAECKVGQGIFVEGVAAAGTHLVTTIAAIPSTTSLTLAAPATFAAVGARRVQHDDTAAINAAISAAFTALGGRVFLRATGCDGYYRCNGAFNATTKSILTVPQDIGYTGAVFRLIQIVGEIRGHCDSGGTGSDGGVFVDCSDAPTPAGTRPALLAVAPYVATTYANALAGVGSPVWNQVEMFVDGMTIMCPENPAFDCLQFGMALRASAGGNLYLRTKLAAGAVVEPTNESRGLEFPQFLNNVQVDCGPCTVVGFSKGIVAGEHVVFRRPYMAYCKVGLYIPRIQHMVEGSVLIERCTRMIEIQEASGDTTYTPMVHLTAQIEIAADGAWYSLEGTNGLRASDDAKGVIYCALVDVRNFGNKILPLHSTSGTGRLNVDVVALGLDGRISSGKKIYRTHGIDNTPLEIGNDSANDYTSFYINAQRRKWALIAAHQVAVSGIQPGDLCVWDATATRGVAVFRESGETDFGGGIKVKAASVAQVAQATGIDYSVGTNIARFLGWGPNNSTRPRFQLIQQSSDASDIRVSMDIDPNGEIDFGGPLKIKRAAITNAADSTGVDYETTGKIARFLGWGPDNSTYAYLQLIQLVANGTSPRIALEVNPTGVIKLHTLPVYADNAAALTALLIAGQLYKTADGTVKQVY